MLLLPYAIYVFLLLNFLRDFLKVYRAATATTGGATRVGGEAAVNQPPEVHERGDKDECDKNFL